MSSIQSRCLRWLSRMVVRRRDWGSSEALPRRARFFFGAPRPHQWLRSFQVEIRRTRPEDPPGEWVIPREAVRRTILYCHGGGYVACSAATHRPITAALARLAPARVFWSDYRLAPACPYPAALDDAERTYLWLLSLGTMPEDIALAGDSAGGGLVVALLHRLKDHGLEVPACAVLFSPWTDVSGSGESVKGNDGRDPVFRTENIQAFAACYAPQSEWTNPYVSPLFGDLANLPPLHIQVGADEVLLDDATLLHDGVVAAGRSSELLIADGVFHGWQMLDGIVPEARETLDQASRFIVARTQRRRGPS